MEKYINAQRFLLMTDALFQLELIDKNTAELIKSLIQGEPAANVQEVKHAHWVQPNPYCKPFCSGCNTFEQSGKKKNYCSECGAIMDGKE
jgi:hypothetical protein